MRTISYIQALGEALREEMQRDPTVFILGEDVASNLFGATTGFTEEFGAERVRNTPISEGAIAGAAIGAAMVGMRPVADFTISSFLYVAMDQIVSIAAKSTYLYGGQAKIPVVMRSCMFYGNGNAAQHSDRPYAMFATVPGLKIVVPTTPYDIKGLLKTAIRDDDPVMFFEDGSTWGYQGEVPEEEYLIPLGKAAIRREGTDATVVGIAGAVHHAIAAADMLAGEGISVEVIDPRTIRPLDRETILASVAKTGRLIVTDPAHEVCSVASEISAIVAQEGFWSLQAPILRVTTPDTHVPYSPPVERPLYPSPERIADAVRKVVKD